MGKVHVGTKRQGEVKNSIENGIAKELTCMTHGHELKGWNAGRKGGYQVEGANVEKLGQQ